jgi:hypothetical protein
VTTSTTPDGGTTTTTTTTTTGDGCRTSVSITPRYDKKSQVKHMEYTWSSTAPGPFCIWTKASTVGWSDYAKQDLAGPTYSTSSRTTPNSAVHPPESWVTLPWQIFVWPSTGDDCPGQYRAGPSCVGEAKTYPYPPYFVDSDPSLPSCEKLCGDIHGNDEVAYFDCYYACLDGVIPTPVSTDPEAVRECVNANRDQYRKGASQCEETSSLARLECQRLYGDSVTDLSACNETQRTTERACLGGVSYAVPVWGSGGVTASGGVAYEFNNLRATDDCKKRVQCEVEGKFWYGGRCVAGW